MNRLKEAFGETVGAAELVADTQSCFIEQNVSSSAPCVYVPHVDLKGTSTSQTYTEASLCGAQMNHPHGRAEPNTSGGALSP